MKLKSAKAFRNLAALAAIGFTFGCETTAESETVPVRVSSAPVAPPVAVEPAAVVTPVAVAPALTAAPATNVAVVSTNAVAAPDDDSGVIEAVAPTLPANIKFSEPVKEIVKLGQSTVDDAVLLAFVANAKERFDLEADEILYLHDVGVPSTVIAEMLKKDGQNPALAEMTETTAPDVAALNGPATNAAPAAVSAGVPPPQPQQQAVEVTTNYIPNTAAAPQQQVVVVQQPQPQTTVVYTTPQPEQVTYFYDSLSPYGSWYVTPEYGWVWQPTVAVVDTGWRPYGPRGRWVWSSAGWYWHSDYSWGWAPFHYGRWYLSSHRGWVWVPDTTWGPSWVTWRYSSDYCGWAPLPPAARFHHGVGFTYYGSSVGFSFSFGLGYDRFCFVPSRHFYHHRPWDYHLDRHYVRSAYDSCRPINRWEFRGRDHFVNHGPGREHVERHTGARLQEVAIKDAPSPATGVRAPRERIERRGETAAAIYRPAPPKNPTQVADNMPASRRDLGERNNRIGVSPASGVVSKDPLASGRAPASTPRTPATGPLGDTPSRRSIPSRNDAVAAKPNYSAPAPAVTTTPRNVARPQATQPLTQPSVRETKPSYTAPQPSRRDYTAKPQVAAPTPTPQPATPAPAPEIQRTIPSRRDYNNNINPSRNAPAIQAPAQAPVVTPSTPAPAPSRRDYTPAPTFQKPATRIETPAPSRRDFSTTPAPAPSYTPPSRRDFATPAPSYTPPPSRRDYAAPAPSYSAPAPTYSAPSRAPATAPAPSYSAPSRGPSSGAPSQAPSYSAPSRGPSGGGGGEVGRGREERRGGK